MPNSGARLSPKCAARALAAMRCQYSQRSAACIRTRRPLAVLLRCTACLGRSGSQSSWTTLPISSGLSCSSKQQEGEEEEEAAVGWGGSASRQWDGRRPAL